MLEGSEFGRGATPYLRTLAPARPHPIPRSGCLYCPSRSKRVVTAIAISPPLEFQRFTADIARTGL